MAISLREVRTGDIQMLYDLLADRPDYANISHKQMPTFQQHIDFVKGHLLLSKHYLKWYVINENQGAISMTHNSEIGIQIFTKYQGNGTGSLAVIELIKMHTSRTWLANISPKNEGSQKFFKDLGFEHIQNTYKLEVK